MIHNQRATYDYRNLYLPFAELLREECRSHKDLIRIIYA